MPPKWYRHVMRVLSESQVVLEVRDVRYPEETRWEKLHRLEDVFNFTRVVVLNKADLVPRAEAERVKEEVELKENVPTVYVSARERMGFRHLRRTIYEVAPEVETVRVGVVGFQNVGKSTIINALTRRSAAETSRRAGYTRGKQWVRGGRRLLVIDSPGVIPTDEATAEAVALDPDVLEDPMEPALGVIERVVREYPGALFNRFGVDESKDPWKILRDISERLGKDLRTTAKLLLREWVDGSLVEIYRTTRDDLTEASELEVGGTAQRLVEETLREIEEVAPEGIPPSAATVRGILTRLAYGENVDGVGFGTVRLGEYSVGVSVGDRYYDRMIRRLRRELGGEVVSEERFRVGANGRKAVVLVTKGR
ncbi:MULTISPECIES: GTPase [unclassified Methanopyrus]|uniref:GTPase n=1 Tax=Methanopyrus sp. SNP6 TaxID=1937005 RepID=UPI0011E5A510|nr:GTPase [Methanopyrus sp. SNP6]